MANQGKEYGKRAYRDEETLRELYFDRDMSTGEIGELLGVSGATVWYWADKFGFDMSGPTAEERFEPKYGVDETTGCWEWTAATDKDGYGVHSDDDDNYIRAHRFSYQTHKGEIPDGAYVLHNCHNPGCVNPNHLRVGDNSDNMVDAFEEGGVTPEMQRERVRKLNIDQVVEIRHRYQEEDITQEDLASEYGVSGPTVNELLKGITWSDVDGPTIE